MAANLANLSPERLERRIYNIARVIEMYTQQVEDARRDVPRRRQAFFHRADALQTQRDLLAEKERRHRTEFREFQAALRVSGLQGRQPRLPRSVIEQIGRELYKM